MKKDIISNQAQRQILEKTAPWGLKRWQPVADVLGHDLWPRRVDLERERFSLLATAWQVGSAGSENTLAEEVALRGSKLQEETAILEDKIASDLDMPVYPRRELVFTAGLTYSMFVDSCKKEKRPSHLVPIEIAGFEAAIDDIFGNPDPAIWESAFDNIG